MDGRSASKSLTQAMKWMRESDNFIHVRYWAPFVNAKKDTTNPQSHHVMASSNGFSFPQAFAPKRT